MTSQGLLIRINEKTRIYDCYPRSNSPNPTELITELKEGKGNLQYFCDSKGNPLKEKVAFLHSDEEAEKRRNFIRNMVESNNLLNTEKEELHNLRSDYQNCIANLGTSQESLEDLKKYTLLVEEQNKRLDEQNKKLEETNEYLRKQNKAFQEWNRQSF